MTHPTPIFPRHLAKQAVQSYITKGHTMLPQAYRHSCSPSGPSFDTTLGHSSLISYHVSPGGTTEDQSLPQQEQAPRQVENSSSTTPSASSPQQSQKSYAEYPSSHSTPASASAPAAAYGSGHCSTYFHHPRTAACTGRCSLGLRKLGERGRPCYLDRSRGPRSCRSFGSFVRRNRRCRAFGSGRVRCRPGSSRAL